MRTKKPQPFDPEKQYNPGERSVYRGMVIVAERWNEKAEMLLSKNRCQFPLSHCNICIMDGMDCSEFCDEYGRTDNTRIYFRKLYNLKTKSDE